jgi:hypothetical protein
MARCLAAAAAAAVADFLRLLLLPPQVKSPVVGNLVGGLASGTCGRATYRPDFNTAGQGYPTDLYM